MPGGGRGPVPPADLPWPQARAIVAETTVPSFPDVTFDVSKYGAIYLKSNVNVRLAARR
ncbi:MAG TPA: hypothetical protein VGP31_09440 [Planosporangium sp.]|nr:hypothetical protein [Planosporangium sp.]